MIKIADGVWINDNPNDFYVSVFPHKSFWAQGIVLCYNEKNYVAVAELPDRLSRLFQRCGRTLTPTILESITTEYKKFLVKRML